MDKIALATGLGINFHKSTLVPMYVSGEVLAGTRRATNRRVEGFPRTYLGLPLSATKLKLEAFPPLLPKRTSFSSASPLCSYPGSAGRGGGARPYQRHLGHAAHIRYDSHASASRNGQGP